MNEEPISELASGDAALLDLGAILGQNLAFSLVAGRCSAAAAEGLRRLREEKLYKRCTGKWDDFCPKYLKISRVEADRTIKLWEEFGPAYFELSQLTRVSPQTFRAIAPSIQDGALRYNGETIELNAENTRKVAAAIAALRRSMPKKSRNRPRSTDREAGEDLRGANYRIREDLESPGHRHSSKAIPIHSQQRARRTRTVGKGQRPGLARRAG